MLASLLLAAIAYVSPVHYPIELAGNFGEPRPNHFHAGIDVKTDRMTGKPLYAMADGFISKVSVGTHGFGKAVYVRHPDGNTSVYVHLDDFAPQIEAAVKRYQYAHKVYATDITFPATMMPVHKGQFIGFSGNTGSSQGPHLHLELHRTQTGDLLDPLAYLKAYVRDTIAPAVYAFKAYPVPGEGTFQHGSSPRVFTFDKGHFSAWGKVGFGVRTMDHMNGVYNSFGSRLIRLYCDGRLVFSADINGLPQSMHRMMNSWGDYDHFMQSRVWFLKSFVEPGNRLPFLKTGQGKGYILFNERREYRLRYVVSDVFGNQTVREFTVLGTPEALGPRPVIAGPEALLTSRDNHWQTDGIRLDVVPSAIFTYPEAACVGPTEDQLKQSGAPYTVRKSFYRSNGKAVAMEETEGLLKLFVAEDGKLLGCHVYGAHAADIVQEVSALICREATVEDLHDTIHIHPTLSEILLDAAM